MCVCNVIVGPELSDRLTARQISDHVERTSMQRVLASSKSPPPDSDREPKQLGLGFRVKIEA